MARRRRTVTGRPPAFVRDGEEDFWDEAKAEAYYELGGTNVPGYWARANEIFHELVAVRRRQGNPCGVRARGRHPSTFDQEQLEHGTRVEMEHTCDPRLAMKIAMDHLVEDPDYYVKLGWVHSENPMPDKAMQKMIINNIVRIAQEVGALHPDLIPEYKNDLRKLPYRQLRKERLSLERNEIASTLMLLNLRWSGRGYEFKDPEFPGTITSTTGLKRRDENPSPEEHYEEFHGVEPDEVTDGRLWVPGKMVVMAPALQVEYAISDPRSQKLEHADMFYHNHDKCGWLFNKKHCVFMFRKARRGEEADIDYNGSFPAEVMVLGWCVSFTVEDERGEKKQKKLNRSYEVCALPDRKTIAIVHKRNGVKWLIRGGELRIDDWIYG